MSLVLPSSVDYKQGLPALPDATQCINVASNPINGASFAPGSQIQFDLLNRGFLVPDSMYLSYSYSITNLVGAEMRGCPVYTPFQRLDIQIGSQTVDTIQSYNVVMNMLSNLNLDVAQKYGMQSSFGYLADTGVPSLEALDGRLCTVNESGSFSAPLVCLLSNAEKLIPLFAMPQVRVVLTMDNISNMFTSTIVPTGFTISNVELRYKVVDMGGAVENIVLGMGDKLYIKSQSFSASSQTLPTFGPGFAELVYSQRYASCKSVFAINGSASANAQFDSIDLTSNRGDYSFSVGGVVYPQKPISTATAKAQALLELKSATGSIFDRNNNFSINSVEFNRIVGSATTYNAPGKYYVGTSLEKLNSESLLTGISTQNSPITYRLNCGLSTGASSTITLVVNYDALIELDTRSRQASVKA